MPSNMTYPEQPVLSKPDSGSTQIHNNSTITASGSFVVSGIGSKELTLVVNVTASPTGTTPTLTYTLQEVDPGNLTSVFGSTVSTSAINAIGVFTISLGATVGGAVKVSWVIGGTSSPTFTGVYATTSSKVGTATSTAGTVIVSDASIGSNNAAAPTSSAQIGGSDGTNLQAMRVFDADSGGGTQYVLGAVLRKSASGGSVELGTSSDPIRVDPTGTTTQPVSGTVTANIGTSGSLALDATLTGGTQKAIVRGGAKGGTTAADVTSTATGANHQALDVAIVDASGNQITTFGGGTQFADGAARGSATGTLMMVDDGTLIQSASGDANGRLNTNSRVTDGTNTAAVKAASTAAVAADPALVIAVSPNNVVSVASGSVSVAKGLVAGTTGWQGGYLSTSSLSILAIRASTYTPQASNFTATIVSSNTNDTSAGTAARTILITYYDQSMAGPFTETITMNGTSNVTSSNTNYCYIESILVVTAGSYATNQGNISLKNGGTTVATVLADEGKLNLAHHYVAAGKTCFIRGLSLSSTAVNGSAILRIQNPITANGVSQQVGNFVRVMSSQLQLQYSMWDFPIVGPSYIALYFRSDTTTSNTIYGGFTFFDS